MIRLQLSFQESPLGERQFDRDCITIGRDGTNDVVLDHPGISRRHLEIVRQGNDYVLSDCGSSNGTLVNQEKCRTWILEDKDVIQVGAYEIVVRLRTLDTVDAPLRVDSEATLRMPNRPPGTTQET